MTIELDALLRPKDLDNSGEVGTALDSLYLLADKTGWALPRRVAASTLLGGNVIVVDGVTSTSLAAAQTAASSGDLIDIYPGSYTITAALGKNGVNWNLRAGVTITQSTLDQSVFGDGGTAMTYCVSGHAELILSGNGGSDSVNTGCLKVSHASSDITLHARKLTISRTNGFSTFASGVVQTAGTMQCIVDVIDASGTGAYGGWWENGGGYLKFQKMTVGDSGGGGIGGSVSATPTGDWYVTGQSIVGGGYGVSLTSTQAEAKLWIIGFAKIESASIGQAGVICLGGKLYVAAAKIANGSGGTATLYAPVTVTGGQCWVTAQKLTSNTGCGIGVTGGTLRANVLQIEDLGSMARAITNSGGTLELHGTQAVMATGDGINHSAGTSRLMGCRLDTSASAGKNPVAVSGSGLILDHCTLVPNAAADSVTAASGKTITAYKTVAKTAKNVNVTVNVDALTVDSNVV